MKVSWHTHPFISGLLVVQEPTRLSMAKASARSFLAQTWPVKELVIVNATDKPLDLGRELSAPSDRFMGALIRDGLSAAHGEWCALLRDDEWYCPTYLERVMIQHDPGTVAVVLDPLIYFVNLRESSRLRRWSLACPTFYRRAAPAIGDSFCIESFVRQFPSHRAIESQSPLVARFLFQ